jgi:AcrR family transcriptional regulator
MARVARELFLQKGYAATRMADIAGAAGVSVETLYATFGPKARLAQFLIEISLSGEDEPVPSLQRDWVIQARAAPNPAVLIDLFAAGVRALQERLAPIWELTRDASKEDETLATIMEELEARRHRDMRVLIEDIKGKGGLRADLDIDAAVDTVWALNSSELYLLLVSGRGWKPAQFQEWFADTLKRLLLPPDRGKLDGGT